MPGSPPTRTRDPGTIPPPSTRSSSRMPVRILTSSSAVTSFRGITFASRTDSLTLLEVTVLPFVMPLLTLSSTNVFHSPHAGHCPSHFDSSCPQFWQKNTLFFPFAILHPFRHTKPVYPPGPLQATGYPLLVSFFRTLQTAEYYTCKRIKIGADAPSAPAWPVSLTYLFQHPSGSLQAYSQHFTTFT